MSSTRTLFLVAAAAFLGAAVAAPLGGVGTAFAKDDKADAAKKAKEAEALQKKRDEYKTKLKTAKKWYTFDLTYQVDPAKLDSRWSWNDPPSPQAKWEEGAMFSAAWESKPGAGGIRVFIQKWIQGTSTTTSTFNFDSIGMKCEVKELEKVITGFSEEWRKKASSHVESKCEKVQDAKGMGPAKFYACVTADDPDSHKRERHEWYVWAEPNETWMAFITFDAATAEKPDWLDMGRLLIKSLKEDKSRPK